MKSVKLNFLLIFFLIFGLSYQGRADCTSFATRHTQVEAIFGGDWVKKIKVKAIKDQGVNDYFNPKIKVCAYDGKSYCYDLKDKEFCRQIYGTQETGGGVSAAAFVDWEGDRMLANGTIKEKNCRGVEGGIVQDLRWEWEDSVTDAERIKFANSPKICACSQKSACVSGISSFWGTKVSWEEDIFCPGNMYKVCDTCYQTPIKCVPIPFAPGPPPFCDQLGMSPPQVRIVPIKDEENDYFDPKVKVIIGDLKGRDGEIGEKLDFPEKYKKTEAKEHPVLDKDGTKHYFKTYREKDKLCAEYRGTEEDKSKRKLQLPAWCFPAPPAPEIKEVSIPEPEESKDKNTLKVKIETSVSTCTKAGGVHSGNLCTFYVNTDSDRPTNIGPLSLTVIKPAIVEKADGSDNSQGNIDDIMEDILKNNSQFDILKKHDYVPDIMVGCSGSKDFYSLKDFNEEKLKECKSENLGQPEIEVKYNDNPKSKMLCLSGWKPEPEEFILKRESEMIPLKSMGATYIKYNAVYSKESNQFYYLPSKDEEGREIYINVLTEFRDKLNNIIFDKQGYVFFPDDNKQEKGGCSYCVDKNNEIDAAFQSGEGLKVVYKLIDGKREEKCGQSADGCICFGETCSRSTQYEKDNQPFYLEVSQDVDGVVKKLDDPVKANRTEVFYADKLCRFDLEGLKKELTVILKRQLENKSTNSYEFSGDNNYTDDLSIYDYVEIKAWGGGGAGHLSESAGLLGMPGDYVSAQLKIDPNHPIIRVEVGEGGRQEYNTQSMNGKPTLITMCDLHKQNCLPVIAVKGGGYDARSWKDTKVHAKDLKLEEPEIVIGNRHVAGFIDKDKQIAYIEDGQMKYKDVEECREDYVDGTHGAGGCIDKSRGTYGRGSPGYVKIKPMFNEINESKINDAIEKMIQSPNSIKNVDDSSTNKLNDQIIGIITKEIKTELLGRKPKDSRS